MEPYPADQLPVIVAAMLAFPLTLLWMGVHILGLVRLSTELKDASQRVKIAWALSAMTGFMGPCVILGALAGMGMALMERGSAEAHPATRRVAGYVLLAGAIILVMTAVLVTGTLISVAMGPA